MYGFLLREEPELEHRGMVLATNLMATEAKPTVLRKVVERLKSGFRSQEAQGGRRKRLLYNV